MALSLPSFSSPPVTEVVIASRFEPPATYNVLTVGDAARAASGLGHSLIEERPGYEAPEERFGVASAGPQVSLEVLSGPPPSRIWFRNPAGDELLQLQPNWLGANWRKVAPDAAYGRWDSRWSAFAAWAEQVERSIAEKDALDHDQVEVTYVNHIEGTGVWSSHAEANKVFSFVSPDWLATPGLKSEPEFGSTDLRYAIPSPDGSNPIGRLHVKISAVFKRPTNEPAFLMDLTARGRPTSNTLAGVKDFAEVGHEWIVRTFAQLTTPEMHQAWGRHDEEELLDV